MGVKDDFKKLKGTIRGWTSTEEGYRGVVAAVIFAVGYFGVIGQLSGRLEEARFKHAEVSKLAEMVEHIRYFEEETRVYQDRLTPAASSAAWGDYVLGMMDTAGVDFMGFNQLKTESYASYEVLRFEVAVTGDYEKLVDFLDRLERGKRYVRIDAFTIGIGQEALLLNCTVRCLAGMTEGQRQAKLMGSGASRASSRDTEADSNQTGAPDADEISLQGGA